MFKYLIIFIALLPAAGFAQVTISGRVINQTNKTPVANASIFLSNASVGGATADDGKFILSGAKSGKYQLVVSVVGFEAYRQVVVVSNGNIALPDIEISPKAVMLGEVKIKPKNEQYRARNIDWFKEEFLGKSYLAKDCEILNAQLLDFDYDESTSILTASTTDFLIIQNNALGYKIKYLLANFTMDNKDEYARRIHYEGSALFENMKGTPAQEKRWQNRRQEVYEGSEMHFLRSAINDHITEEGFRVLLLARHRKTESPDDSAMAQKLVNIPLSGKDIIEKTGQEGIYALIGAPNALHVTYRKDHHFPKGARLENMDYATNTDQTILNLNKAKVLFDDNGVLVNPNDVSLNGAWGRNRVAELLPVDYEPDQKAESARGGESIVAKLKNFSEQHITEKAYLHFDKPYYAVGDTIYFKAYVTAGEEHQLSDISGILHVDLINGGNKVGQSIKLQLTDGVAWGDFALPDTLPKGSYRVRAYTQVMRNDGDGAFFEQKLPVGSINNNKVPESGSKRNATAMNAKPDLQFFAEGGTMVTGIKSKIAFKAIAGNGLGIDVKGVVTDNDGKEVATFASARLGMGSFDLTPQPGKTYQAKLAYADGAQATISLPAATDDGIVLTVNNDSLPKASVTIAASKGYFQQNKNKDYSLLIYSGGIATTVTCPLDSSVITLDILKRRLHTGVATVTLFSPVGEPLCERLLFVQNYDQLSLAVNSDKTSYTKRGKVNIKLNVKNRADAPAQGHFSVSVVNENLVPVDANSENTILTNLLLTSDLKGFIEQPNYYFNNINSKTLADLDLVMLTHGYRRFEWKQVLNNDNPEIAWQPEKSLEIAGTATNLFNKPIAKGTVSLIAQPSGLFVSATTDDKGQFRFSNLDFTDTAKYMLQAINAKGKNSTRLVYNKGIPLPVTPVLNSDGTDVNQSLSPYLENNRQQQAVITQFGDITGKLLKTVTVKGQKIAERNTYNNLVSEQFADQVIHTDDMAKGGLFSERLQGALHGAFIQRASGGIAGSYAYLYNAQAGLNGATVPMRVILDGSETDGDLDEIEGEEVEMVEVLKTPGTLGVYNSLAIVQGEAYKAGWAGILVINTKAKKGLQAEDISSIGVLGIKPKGYHIAREFYSPKYDAQNITNPRPDLRSTIYWKPELVTDKDGNTAFDYYNADGIGTYRVTIEGIDDNGNLGRQVFQYKVE